jgi:hypothetical protein
MGLAMVLPLLQFFYNHFVVEHVVLVGKLSMNSLSMWKRCWCGGNARRRDGDKGVVGKGI